MVARKIVRRSCLGARPRYNLVVDEDIKKPNKQTKNDVVVVVVVIIIIIIIINIIIIIILVIIIILFGISIIISIIYCYWYALFNLAAESLFLSVLPLCSNPQMLTSYIIIVFGLCINSYNLILSKLRPIVPIYLCWFFPPRIS